MSFNDEQPLTVDVIMSLERAFDSEWDSAPRGQKNYVEKANAFYWWLKGRQSGLDEATIAHHGDLIEMARVARESRPIINQRNSRDYTVNLSIKRVNRFGVKWKRLGEFRFCALANQHEASCIAAGNARVKSLDETVYTQVINVLPCLDAVEVQG